MVKLAGGWFRRGPYKYADTGEKFYGTPAKTVIGDPLTGARYYDANGRELLPL